MITTAIARELAKRDLVTYSEDGGDVFVEEDLPPDPQDAVRIQSAGGPPASMTHGYDTPSFQIIVRGGSDAREPHARAMDIYDALHGLRYHELPDGTFLVWCAADQSAPVPLGRDENRRHQFSLNFTAEVRAASQHRQ
jgi:hypothetical protein